MWKSADVEKKSDDMKATNYRRNTPEYECCAVKVYRRFIPPRCMVGDDARYNNSHAAILLRTTSFSVHIPLFYLNMALNGSWCSFKMFGDESGVLIVFFSFKFMFYFCSYQHLARSFSVPLFSFSFLYFVVFLWTTGFFEGRTFFGVCLKIKTLMAYSNDLNGFDTDALFYWLMLVWHVMIYNEIEWNNDCICRILIPRVMDINGVKRYNADNTIDSSHLNFLTMFLCINIRRNI